MLRAWEILLIVSELRISTNSDLFLFRVLLFKLRFKAHDEVRWWKMFFVFVFNFKKNPVKMVSEFSFM